MFSICRINIIEPLVEKMFNLTCDGLTDFASITLKECAALDALIDSMSHNYRPSPIALPVSNTKLLPSIVQALKLELKELPSLLKYIYLGNNRLKEYKAEEKLIEMLKEYKAAIGWTITDIKGLNPSTYIHCILLEGDSKPTRKPQ